MSDYTENIKFIHGLWVNEHDSDTKKFIRNEMIDQLNICYKNKILIPDEIRKLYINDIIQSNATTEEYNKIIENNDIIIGDISKSVNTLKVLAHEIGSKINESNKELENLEEDINNNSYRVQVATKNVNEIRKKSSACIIV